MIKKTLNILKVFYRAGYTAIYKHDAIEHAGYLAFLGLLALFPALVFMFAIVGQIGRLDIGAEVIKDFSKLLPGDVMLALSPRINEILSGPPQGLLTLAIIGTLWTSSSAVEGIRTVLNNAYRVSNPPAYIFRRIMSIIQFIVLTFLIVIAMIFLTVAPAIWDYIQHIFGFKIEFEEKWSLIRFYSSSGVVFFVIMISYYVLPNIKMRLLWVLPGTLIVSVLWIFFADIFTNVIQNYRGVNLVYGSLAGVILTLIFFYILSLIYIYGAEFNHHLEQYLDNKIINKTSAKRKVK
jgi:membrane protein